MKTYLAIRGYILSALFAAAVGAWAWRDGHNHGVREQIGGSGVIDQMTVEWIGDRQNREVLCYLNDGAYGYAFTMKLDPQYRHYTNSTRVFGGNNEAPKEPLEMARWWWLHGSDRSDSTISHGIEWEQNPGTTKDKEEKSLDFMGQE